MTKILIADLVLVSLLSLLLVRELWGRRSTAWRTLAAAFGIVVASWVMITGTWLLAFIVGSE